MLLTVRVMAVVLNVDRALVAHRDPANSQPVYRAVVAGTRLDRPVREGCMVTVTPNFDLWAVLIGHRGRLLAGGRRVLGRCALGMQRPRSGTPFP